MPPALLLLTEDSGGQGYAVLQAITEKMLRLIDPAADIKRIHYYPASNASQSPAETAACAAMNFNGWKDRGATGHRKQIDLCQAIATRLLRSDGFVVLHFDGDLRWADSQGGMQGPNWEAFRERLLPRIKLLLQQKNQPEHIDKLLLLVPFRCMESWLYQNSETALRIYHEGGSAPREDLRRFEEEWRQDPGQLEETERCPKDLVRIADRHNRRLAKEQFPAERVYQLGKSFAASVERMRACEPLLTALQTIRFGAQDPASSSAS